MSARGKVVMIALVAVAASGGRAFAGASYAAANRAYQDGHYQQAATQYQELVAAGIVNEDLYYNLGNADFRIGKLGPAIYNYERALRIDPDFDDARYNLGVARQAVAARVKDRVVAAQKDPLWIRTVTFFSVGALALWFVILDAVFFAVLIALRFLANGFARTTLVVANSFVAAALVAAMVLLAGHVYFLERVRIGVVLPDQVAMREGADAAGATKGELHAGLRIRIVGGETGWLRVRLSNGVEGWVPRASVGEL